MVMTKHSKQTSLTSSPNIQPLKPYSTSTIFLPTEKSTLLQLKIDFYISHLHQFSFLGVFLGFSQPYFVIMAKQNVSNSIYKKQLSSLFSFLLLAVVLADFYLRESHEGVIDKPGVAYQN